MADMIDVWGALYDAATGEDGVMARIELDPETDDTVTLVWPDGSRGGLYWHDGDWQFADSMNSAPCDVSARDA